MAHLSRLINMVGLTYPYMRKEAGLMALRAIVFDCDGVLMDSEPLHFAAFKKILAAEGEELTHELYVERYLAHDDRGAFKRFFEDRKKPLDDNHLQALMEKKTIVFQELVSSEGILPFPAVPEFVMAVAQRYPLAVATGARRHEVELLLETAGIRRHFEAVISADDVENGKPNPESYEKALHALNASGKRPMPIRAEECVVIEDSISGIASAHTAGMKCVAVASSYPAFELSHADLVVPNLAALKVSQIEDLFVSKTPQPIPSQHPQN